MEPHEKVFNSLIVPERCKLCKRHVPSFATLAFPLAHRGPHRTASAVEGRTGRAAGRPAQCRSSLDHGSSSIIGSTGTLFPHCPPQPLYQAVLSCVDFSAAQTCPEQGPASGGQRNALKDMVTAINARMVDHHDTASAWQQ